MCDPDRGAVGQVWFGRWPVWLAVVVDASPSRHSFGTTWTWLIGHVTWSYKVWALDPLRSGQKILPAKVQPQSNPRDEFGWQWSTLRSTTFVAVVMQDDTIVIILNRIAIDIMVTNVFGIKIIVIIIVFIGIKRIGVWLPTYPFGYRSGRVVLMGTVFVLMCITADDNRFIIIWVNNWRFIIWNQRWINRRWDIVLIKTREVIDGWVIVSVGRLLGDGFRLADFWLFRIHFDRWKRYHWRGVRRIIRFRKYNSRIRRWPGVVIIAIIGLIRRDQRIDWALHRLVITRRCVRQLWVICVRIGSNKDNKIINNRVLSQMSGRPEDIPGMHW